MENKFIRERPNPYGLWYLREYEYECVKCGVSSYAIRCPICGITLHKGENFESLDAFQKFINDMCKERNLTFDKYCHNCGTKMKAR